MTSQDYANAQLATACWRAAKSELHNVMLYVCMVFMNRARAGWYAGDIYENAIRWLAENPGEFPDLREPQFQQLLNKLDLVTSGQTPDKTDGALWFAPKTVEKIEGTITTTVGGLIFIR